MDFCDECNARWHSIRTESNLKYPEEYIWLNLLLFNFVNRNTFQETWTHVSCSRCCSTSSGYSWLRTEGRFEQSYGKEVFVSLFLTIMPTFKDGCKTKVGKSRNMPVMDTFPAASPLCSVVRKTITVQKSNGVPECYYTTWPKFSFNSLHFENICLGQKKTCFVQNLQPKLADKWRRPSRWKHTLFRQA
jgi:hypothetical protein